MLGRPTQRVTRLAPSPTGALHLGNARTFVMNWALARQAGWRIVLRVEDLAGPRVSAEACAMSVEDLAWLGLDWDEGPYFQQHDLTPYTDALATLTGRGLTYPCVCRRGQVIAAQPVSVSAPHVDEHELRYPGTCRDRLAGDLAAERDLPAGIRLRVPDEAVTFHDTFAGEQTFNPQQSVGDFLLIGKSGLPAYQLTVVVDDHRQGVTDIVRADDLLGSAARQLLLYRLLGYEPEPTYVHVPLLYGADGRRLAKRHGDTRLRAYRERGVPVERIIGLLAWWCGIVDRPTPLPLTSFCDRFRLDRLSHEPIRMTPEEDAWLLAEVS